jgi:hypothetical protein
MIYLHSRIRIHLYQCGVIEWCSTAEIRTDHEADLLEDMAMLYKDVCL